MIEFSVGNYRSFKDVVTFSMVAAPIPHEDETTDLNNVFAIAQDIDLLKSAAIYGANASGKSNLIRAIAFVKSFVLNSAIGRRVKEPIETEVYKLSKDTENEPSYFEIIFSLGKNRYRYGFEVDRHSIKSEWLYQTLTITESELFSREGKDINVSKNFEEGQDLANRTRADALFLSVVAQFAGDIATDITDWFDSLVIISDIDDEVFCKTITDNIVIEDNNGRQYIKDLTKSLDLGIEDINLFKIPIDAEQSSFRYEIKTTHWKYDAEGNKLSLEKFDIGKEESAGTQKLYGLSGMLMNLIRIGGILIVDELDARLHPLITCAIVRLFNSSKTNPNNAQLIFTTHDTNLLSCNLFRKDQVWFTEKNRYGATDLYSLVEYKIPWQASFEQDYIAGKYGAVPFIGDLSRLLGKK
ncbi:AAA family ATPase [Chamaesiphon polymorphus]|uniref:Abortive infection protein n=1 Tax=Chamaesiphon polymorphus CCALA 037 TaxID=2107692 RepID=A0A2T1GJC6_9CYAN|nr:ATP-binding protein [Chamaesiphon polymorphus]PSB57905.1 abortive infection protein [Chamaesiphon polymorphus CCALA 037]